MTIEQTETIDFLSVEKVTGVVRMTISDHLDWNSEKEHIDLLQDKINAYLRFIEGGELIDNYPEYRGKKIVIYIAAKYNPSTLGLLFLEHAREITKSIGLGIVHEVIQSEQKQ